MATKPTRELYRGKAIIMNINLEFVADWKDWEKKNLSLVDLESAFKIVYNVAEGDAQGARHEVKIEASHRELSGKMLDFYKREDGTAPTQIDVALRSLKQQGLCAGASEADLAAAIEDANCGKIVTIRAFEEQSDDGKWWPRCTFASKFQRVSGGEKAALLAAFLAGKAYKPATSEPAAAATAIPAPADDADDMPF